MNSLDSITILCQMMTSQIHSLHVGLFQTQNCSSTSFTTTVELTTTSYGILKTESLKERMVTHQYRRFLIAI